MTGWWLEEAPDLPDDDRGAQDEAATLDPKNRLARWQRKLLDLSLRNNILNFRTSKKAPKPIRRHPGLLEDLMAESLLW